ncbi:kinase-like domain-containing protein [Mycena polygramma]|nr:kinase-like domain-containing protein [Mycena polygramma]
MNPTNTPYGLKPEHWADIGARGRRLSSDEKWWADKQPFLFSCGYELRPRYRPNWTPTWELPGNERTWPTHFEDYISNPGRGNTLDAIRIADNVKVVLKSVKWAHEIELTRRFGKKLPEERPDPQNRCIPLLDVIYPPEEEVAILVLPFLREFDDPPFERLGEVREALEQFLQGMEYLHANHVAHRDLCRGNLMMDATRVVPKGWHFAAPYSNTGTTVELDWEPRFSVPPVPYFIIDFGLSTSFQPHISLEEARVVGKYGQDKYVPELSDTVPYNPFKVDIYQLGNVIMALVESYEGLEIFRGLAECMTRQNPDERPTASESVQLFYRLVSTAPEHVRLCRISSDSDDLEYDSHSSEEHEGLKESASEVDSGDDELYDV